MLTCDREVCEATQLDHCKAPLPTLKGFKAMVDNHITRWLPRGQRFDFTYASFHPDCVDSVLKLDRVVLMATGELGRPFFRVRL